MKYNYWEIINNTEIHKLNAVYFRCRCACGEEREVRLKNLKSGQSKSCGCIGRKKTTERNMRHGKRYTRTWRIWQAMKTRCYNKNTPQWCNYGGRGIKVCSRWKDDFMEFYNDMGEAPQGCSIDRIDNDENYCKENCKWSTQKEQCRNKSNNNKINGVCITKISRDLGGGHSLVAKRLKRGWDLERAITEKTNANT